MNSTAETAAEGIREQIRARARARSAAWLSRRTPPASRAAAIAAAVLLHGIAAIWLYHLMRIAPTPDRGRVEVRLLDAAPTEPALPEPPQKARTDIGFVPPPTVARPPRAPAPPPAAETRGPEPTITVDTARLFHADGSVRIPRMQEPPKLSPHAEGIQRGREMMARGLDCEAHAADDVAHRESVGEEVTRKYLAWIGLYNPAAAQLRAEQEEQRQTRCRLSKEAAP